MKKEIMNSINTLILKMSIAFCFVCFIGLSSAWSQNGKVPELVNVQVANDRLILEIKQIVEQISVIEGSGGTVDPELRFKLQLYKAVYDETQKNNPGVLTFNAVAGNSNYKLLVSDEQAYNDLINGNWDQNMADLIRLLTK